MPDQSFFFMTVDYHKTGWDTKETDMGIFTKSHADEEAEKRAAAAKKAAATRKRNAKKAETAQAKDPERVAGGHKAAEGAKMRDTRDENTPDAKATASSKERAAERQFAKADAKNQPSTVGAQNESDRTKAITEARKVADQAEKDRLAAKKEAMKPATDEQIAETRTLVANRGYM